jgi:glycosyltransferase involved in cell wall biosynthesis
MKVITPSQYLKSIVQGWGVVEERVQVIYNAVEQVPEDLEPPSKVRAQLGFSENDHLVITSARLVSWKGIDSLIRSITLLDESVNLLVVGDGPEKNKLTDLAEHLSVAGRVRFFGKVKRYQALAYIKAADVFILNTRYEGFSHVLLEAMTLGTPVMTTPVCGNPELVCHEQNGLLVEQGNPDLLAAGITRVLGDAALRKQLIEGGEKTIQQYSWDRLIRQTTEVLCGY